MVFAALRAAGMRPRVLAPTSQGYVYHLPSLLSPEESKSLFASLLSIRWRTETDHFGPQQRQTAFFGDEGATFQYVGLTLQPNAWPEALQTARQRANLVAAAHGPERCTACLANHYGEDAGYIPWHHDEVRAHGTARLVLALSLGGERRMLLRRRTVDGALEDEISVRLPPGSAMVMAGDAQTHWEHALPLDPGAAPRRISLTFRTLIPGFEDGLPSPVPG